MGYIRTIEKGIVEIKQKGRLGSLFCKHKRIAVGEPCSEHGMTAISHMSEETVCIDCGTVFDRRITYY